MKLQRQTIMKMIGIAMLALIACDDDPMRVGTAAVLSGQAEVAEQNLQRVLKKDPTNGEAARLMAEVHRLRGNFQASEQALNALWKSHGFDGDAQELPSDKALRNRMEQQYNDLYVEWVEKLDPREEPETYEAVLRRGLVRAERSNRLNTLMVEFLLSRAERALEASQKTEAAALYDEILKFRTLPNVRTEAETKGRNLRLEVFSDEVRARIDKEVRPRREVNNRWSTEQNGGLTTIELVLDRKLRPENPADLLAARKLALPVVQEALAAIVADLTGVKVDVARVIEKPPIHQTDGELFKRGLYTVGVSVSTDIAIRYVFDAPTPTAAEQIPEPTTDVDAGESDQ
jgi:hypothetical protein